MIATAPSASKSAVQGCGGPGHGPQAFSSARKSVIPTDSSPSRSQGWIASFVPANLVIGRARLDGLDPDGLRSVVDTLRDRVPSGIILLGGATEGKVNLVAAVSKDLTKRFPAGRLVQEIARMVGGGGGGRPDLAQAGGKDASKLDEALAAAAGWVERAAQG